MLKLNNKSAPLSAEIKSLQELMRSDLDAVNQCIRDWLSSDVPMIAEVGEHLIAAGGKRLRPLLVLLIARALGYRGQQHVILAAIIEFIHTATLLHDDVVDDSGLRRGKRTANAIWGNAPSVLVGDFLYSRSFQMMVSLNKPRVQEILAQTTNRIAEGEVMQLINKGDSEVSSARYLAVIERKTAVLFEAAGRLGALIADRPEGNWAQYGLKLGFAFQIADDVLDYTGDASVIGKNLGDDLAEGKPTLPIIIALKRAEARDAEVLRDAITQGKRELLDEVKRIIRETDALDASIEQAEVYAAQAQSMLKELDGSPYRDALEQLCRYSVNRRQ
jgi:octaprenyl-diphosphate synthase